MYGKKNLKDYLRIPRILLVITTAVVFLTACGDKNIPATTTANSSTGTTPASTSALKEPKTQEEVIALSEELVMKMETGDFPGVSAYFSTKVKEALSDEKLKEAFDMTVKPIGGFKSMQGSKVSQIPVGYIVISYAEHEANTLKITYTWNKENKIDGLWMSYAVAGEAPGSKAEVYSTGDSAVDKAVEIGPHKLKGLIATPKSPIEDKKIIAILVQGSGQSDMDETIGATKNKIFKDLAFGLAKKGISTLRYNKRFYQLPDLAKDPEENTIHSEITDDFESAVKYIKNDPDLKNYEIVVIGHSLGGMLTPYLTTSNKDITKAVSLAGSVRTLWDIILDQNEAAISKLPNETEERKKALLDQVKTMVEEANDLTKPTGKMILSIPDYYVASLNNLGLESLAEKSKLPFLILQGTEDFQVSNKDFQSWKTALKNNKSAEFIEYPGLNHLFMKSTGEKTIDEYNTKANVDQKVIDDIAKFLID